MPPVPARVSMRYKVEEALPAGFFGVTHRAIDTASDGRRVAFKILDARSGGCSAEGLRQIEHSLERQRSAACNGLAQIYQWELYDGYWLVREWLDGASLDPTTPLDLTASLRLLRDAARALHTLHEAGIVHGCLKPANILLTSDREPRVLLTDAGFGPLLDALHAESGSVLRTTYSFLSPEHFGIIRGGVDARSDLYSLGVVAYALLGHRLPFATDSMAALLHGHAARLPRPLREIVEVPAFVEEIVGQLLHKERNERYASTDVLLRDLEEAWERVTAGYLRTAAVPSRILRIAGSALVGRTAQVQALERALGEVRSGRGRVTVIQGAAGSGKTCLVQAARELAERSGLLFCFGKCDQYGSQHPYQSLGAAASTLSAQWGLLPALRREAIQRLVREDLGPSASSLLRVLPELAPLLGEPDRAEPESELAAQVVRQAVIRLFTSLAVHWRPVVLVQDDLHWARPAALDLVAALAQHIDECPMWVLGTVRDEDEAGQAAVHGLGPGVETLTCPPLTEEDVLTVAVGLVGEASDVSTFLGDLLWHRSAGNPFAVMEVLRSLMAGDALVRSPFGWQVDTARCQALALPERLAGLTLGRLHELDPDARRLLALAGLSGGSVDPDLLARATEQPQERVLTTFLAACDRQILEPVGAGYQFLHDRIREAVVEELDEEEQRSAHRALAEAIESRTAEPFSLAHHYRAADDREKALHYLLEACRVAGQAFAWSSVVTLARQALEMLEPTAAPAYPELLFLLGQALYHQGAYGEARAVLKKRLEVVPSVADRVATLELLSRAEHDDGQTPQAVLWVEEALAALGENVPRSPLPLRLGTLRGVAGLLISSRLWPRLRTAPEMRRVVARLYHFAAVYLYFLDYHRCLYVHLQSLRVAHGMPDSEELILIHGAHSVTMGSLGLIRQARAQGQRALAVADALGTHGARANALFMAAAGLYSGGRWAETVPLAEEGVIANRTAGDYWKALICAYFLAIAHLEMGHIDAARHEAERCRKLRQELGSRVLGLQSEVVNDALESRLALIDGRYEEARVLGRRAYESARQCPDRVFKLAGFNTFGRVAMVTGPLDEAIDVLESSVAEMRAYNLVHKFVADGPSLLAEAWVAEYEASPGPTRLARCRRALRGAFFWGRIHATIRPAAWRARARLEAAQGRMRAALRSAARSVQAAVRTEMRHEEGRSLLLRGLLERSMGRNDASLTLLRAEELLDAVGDRPALTRLRSDLVGRDLQRPAPERPVVETGGGLAHRIRRGRVLELSRQVVSVLHLPSLLPLVLASALEITGAQRAILVLTDGVCDGVPALASDRLLFTDGQRAFRACAAEGESSSLAVSLTAMREALREGRTMHYPDAGEHPALFPDLPIPPPLRAIAVIPLLAGADVIGLLYLDSTQMSPLVQPEDVDLLDALGGLSAIGLHNAIHLVRLEAEHARTTEERERRHAEELKVEQLESRKNALAAFLGIASHDLKAPLTLIKLSSHVLKPGIADELLQECRENLDYASRRALVLIQLYLDTVALETGGRLTLQMAELDARRLIQDEYKFQLLALSEKRRSTLQVELALADGTVGGDADRLRQVVGNLLGNALKFGGGGRVRVRSTLDRSRFRCEISDEGPGIAADDQERLFQPFVRVSTSQPGSGLGLWIARTVVEAHGGRIGVHSEPGQGSTFWFELPTQRDAS